MRRSNHAIMDRGRPSRNECANGSIKQPYSQGASGRNERKACAAGLPAFSFRAAAIKADAILVNFENSKHIVKRSPRKAPLIMGSRRDL